MDIVHLVNDVEVNSEGLVMASVPFYLETLCSLDLTHYLYDEQVCPILLIPVLQKFEWAGVESSRADLQVMELSSEWEMVNASVELVCHMKDDELFPKILLHLRRKTTFYTVCLVLPMALTSYMNTLVFLVPLQSGEKVSFLVSIFVSTSVFFSFFATVSPRGLDRVPSTMKLLIGVIVESLLVLLVTIVVLRRNQPVVQATAKKGTNEVAITEKLAATARLKGNIRDLPAAREKVAPVMVDKNGRETVALEVIVSVLAVLGVDDVQQTVSTGVNFYITWDDKSLAWNAFDYNGVNEVTLPVDAVWTPTLFILNSPEARDVLSEARNLRDGLSPKIVLHLRRKTTFYTVCLVLPMVLTSYMNTLVFLVPLQSGEKVSFLVSIFVSTSVYVRRSVI
nr:hypothetical protein BaRGS_029709 [Batillaria attramentaria]